MITSLKKYKWTSTWLNNLKLAQSCHRRLLYLALLGATALSSPLNAKQIAYIYGNVAPDGTIASQLPIPSEAADPYDQMLLTDTGDTGMSMFKQIVEDEGYSISQYYDATTTLDAAFLNQFDVVIFGLHQKVWSSNEQTAIDQWISNGGGILMYNDSAAGGFWQSVGAGNQTGQLAVNSILANYGMQVAVDQAGGVFTQTPDGNSSNPCVWDEPALQGEGVSPIAIDPSGSAVALIPFNSDITINAIGINNINNPIWATLAHKQSGKGNVMAIFDRQPFWNDGPGSSIQKLDNAEILRRIVRFLARDYGNSDEWVDLQILTNDPSDFQISYRQWIGGSGQKGFSYIAKNNLFAVEQKDNLDAGSWRNESLLSEVVSTTPDSDIETEVVTLRLLPDSGTDKWFARVAMTPNIPVPLPAVDAGTNKLIVQTGTLTLKGTLTNASGQLWSKSSGPGTVSFNDTSALETTATFSTTGTYELELSTTGLSPNISDSVTIVVVANADVIVAINCGGNAHNGQNGITYLADTHFNGGGTDAFPGNEVSGSDDEGLYNFARSKETFTGYSIPVTDGNYLVVLNFAETFFTEDNQRVFDVTIEGNLVLDDLDIHAAAPGKWVALEHSFTTSVTGGILNIDFSASTNNSLINGITVIELP